jgi:riboflavin transporter FmnP
MSNSLFETKRLVTLGILSALGAVLMLVEIPYPFVPFLTFDLSDIVVLVVFMVFGFKEATLVAILKAVVHILIKGPVGPMAIGQITAVIASMSYVFGMYFGLKVYKLNRYISAAITVVVVAVVLVIANYLFVTPIWFGGLTFLDVRDWVTLESFGLEGSGGYLQAIVVAYLPFNLLKGVIITLGFMSIYEIIRHSDSLSIQ